MGSPASFSPSPPPGPLRQLAGLQACWGLGRGRRGVGWRLSPLCPAEVTTGPVSQAVGVSVPAGGGDSLGEQPGTTCPLLPLQQWPLPCAGDRLGSGGSSLSRGWSLCHGTRRREVRGSLTAGGRSRQEAGAVPSWLELVAGPGEERLGCHCHHGCFGGGHVEGAVVLAGRQALSGIVVSMERGGGQGVGGGWLLAPSWRLLGRGDVVSRSTGPHVEG